MDGPTHHPVTRPPEAGVFIFSTNLASENVPALKQMRLGLILLSLSFVLLAVFTLLDGLEADTQLAFEKARTAELSEQRTTLTTRMKEDGLDLTEAGLAELRAKAAVTSGLRLFSWSQLLADLEQVVPWGISLASIQPQDLMTRLNLKGEALTPKSLTNFMMKLEKSDTFGNIFLADQKRLKGGTMAFALYVNYRRA